MAAKKDITGLRFGKLLVIRDVGSSHNRTRYNCLCDCGNTKIIIRGSLVSGLTKSCGCLGKNGATIGGKRTPEYQSYRSMMARCYNPKTNDYGIYGGRGIKVCDKWKNNFAQFRKDVGLRPSAAYSLDRIDNNRSYEPGNVRWATSKEQAANRRSHYATASELQYVLCKLRYYESIYGTPFSKMILSRILTKNHIRGL